MRNHNVPKEMQQRVQRWYDYAWSRLVYTRLLFRRSQTDLRDALHHLV